MLTRGAPSPPVTAAARKLDALLTLFESGLREEAFHLAKRDAAALLDLLPRQSVLLDAALALAESAPEKDPSVRLRIENLSATRRENLRQLQDVLSAMNREIIGMQQASGRIRQLRRVSAAAAAPATESIAAWA